MKLKFLGTANSSGIPTHNCQCLICNEYRKIGKINLATSAYIETKNNNIILIDAGIENIASIFDGKSISTIFLTHFHPDHVLGLLRLRYSNDKINCYHPKDENGFSDLFKHKKSINYAENKAFTPITIEDITFTPIPLKHSKNTTGYLIENENFTIAYLTDCAGIEKESMDFLLSKEIDICYIDAGLSPQKEKGNHLNFYEASLILDKINAKKSYLIHSSHETLTHLKSHNIKLKYDYFDI